MMTAGKIPALEDGFSIKANGCQIPVLQTSGWRHRTWPARIGVLSTGEEPEFQCTSTLTAWIFPHEIHHSSGRRYIIWYNTMTHWCGQPIQLHNIGYDGDAKSWPQLVLPRPIESAKKPSRSASPTIINSFEWENVWKTFMPTI